MTGYELATLAISTVQATASLGAVVAILVGLRRMDQANRARRAEAEARDKREDARHAEAMTRLDQQGEALRALVQGLERQGAALEAALKG